MCIDKACPPIRPAGGSAAEVAAEALRRSGILDLKRPREQPRKRSGAPAVVLQRKAAPANGLCKM